MSQNYTDLYSPKTRAWLSVRRRLVCLIALSSVSLFAPHLVFAQATLTRIQILNASLETASVLSAKARVSAAEAQALAANIPISGSANFGYGWTGVNPNPGSGNGITGDWTYGAQVNFAGLFGEASNSRVQASLNLERARLNLSSTVLSTTCSPFRSRRVCSIRALDSVAPRVVGVAGECFDGDYDGQWTADQSGAVLEYASIRLKGARQSQEIVCVHPADLIPVTAGIALTLTAFLVVFERSIVSRIEAGDQSKSVM
jgi:hypothetical protein